MQLSYLQRWENSRVLALATRNVTVPEAGRVNVVEAELDLVMLQDPEVIPHEPVPADIAASITAV